MKCVFSNDMVAHIWANQSQESGRSNNGQFYFNGPILYSYGSHFIVGIVDGAGAHIVTTRTYRQTTGKHIGLALRSCPARALRLPDLDGIADSILCATGAPCPRLMTKETARRDIRKYLAAHAATLSDDAGAYLYSLVSKSGQFAAMKARALAKIAKAKESGRIALKKQTAAFAARYAKKSRADMRADLAQIAGIDCEHRRARAFNDLASGLYEAHRGAGGPRIKRAVWNHLKMTRAYIASDEKRGPGRRKIRGAIGNYRRLVAGNYPGLTVESLGRASTWEILGGLFATLASAPGLSYGGRIAFKESGNQADCIHNVLAERERLAEIERRRIAQAEQFERERLQRESWLAGEIGRGYGRFSDETGGALLRAVNADIRDCEAVGGDLETSHGASVPLAHAIRAFRFVKAVRASGVALEAKGRAIPVGHFSISRIESTGDFVAGCHRINWPEIERVANLLGVFDCPAISEAGVV